LSEITPPPYPADFLTVAGLYRLLQSLLVWVNHEYDALADTSYYEVYKDIDVPTSIPEASIHANVAISDIFYTWRWLRQLREYYDTVIRDFEDEWECEVAIARRADLLQRTVKLLNNAFQSAEVRGAKSLEQEEADRIAAKQMQSKFQALSHNVRQTLREDASKDEAWWSQGMEIKPEEDDDDD